MSVEYDSRRSSLTNLSITTERMEPFNHKGSDGMGMRIYSPYKKYIQGNLTKGAIAALIFILVCILCYLLTSVHHLQSQVRGNEALLPSKQAPNRNSNDLTTKVKTLDDDFQELKRRFDLIGPSVNDAESGINELRTKFDNMQEQLDNLETNLEKTLIKYDGHMNGTGTGSHVDSLVNSSCIRRMNAFDATLRNVQTLAQQNSKLLQNSPANNNSLNPLINTELRTLEDDIEKLKHLVTVPKSCYVYKLKGATESGRYSIDPDGAGNLPPVDADCDLQNGYTSMAHDLLGNTTIDKCEGDACFSKSLHYRSSMAQLKALIDTSSSCYQEIKFDCKSAALVHASWIDVNGDTQDVPKCECSKLRNTCYHSTAEEENFCNCNARPLVQHWQEDVAKVTNRTLLPIKGFRYGYMRGHANVTIGKLFCKGGESPLNINDLQEKVREITDVIARKLGVMIGTEASTGSSGDIKISGTCVGTYDNGKSEITTPNYPRSYPGSKRCNWNIEVPQGQHIELEFNDFRLESHSRCDYDYLQVYDGRSSSSRNLNGKLCGNSKPSKIISSGNTLFLYWRSDSSTSFKGFEISATLTGGAQSGNALCNYKEPCFCADEYCIVGGDHKSGNVFVNRKPVCDDQWALDEVKVFCKEFGFNQALASTRGSKFGDVSSNFATVQCTGNETLFSNCTHNPNGHCRSRKGAGAVCADTSDEELLNRIVPLESSEGGAPGYLPVGPQTDVPMTTVTRGGWSLCFSEPWKNEIKDSVSSIRNTRCTNSRLMLGCRRTGSTTIQLLAWAPITVIFTDTGASSSTTTNSHGTEWYFDQQAWGFASGGDRVSKGSCDTASTNPDKRLCFGIQHGGWRCGSDKSTSQNFEKLIFQGDPSNSERLEYMEDRINSTEIKVAELEIEIGGTLPTVTKVFTDSRTTAPRIQENINVIPNQSYLVDIQIVITDTEHRDEYADVTLDGKNFGRCNPSLPDHRCTWHNCSEMVHGTNVERQAITSTDGVVLFKATYSRDVDQSRTCTVDGFTGTAIVRVTLTPEKRNGSVIEDLKDKIEALENGAQTTGLENRVMALETNLSNTKTTVSSNGNKLNNLKSTVDGIKNRPTVQLPQIDEKSKIWLIGQHSAPKGNLTTGDITFNNFKHGQTTWSRSDSEITIPLRGWYEVTFSATHWSSSSTDNKSQVDLIVNQQTKRSAYGTVGAINWGQNFDRQWFIKLNKNDKIKFQNRNSNTLKVDELNELFVKLQYMTIFV